MSVVRRLIMFARSFAFCAPSLCSSRLARTKHTMAAPPLLKKLSQAVYLAEPATPAQDGVATGGAAKAPELILVSAWMGVRLPEPLCLP